MTHFISGMAQGADLWAAAIALNLKHFCPKVQLECAVPCDTQSRNWPEDKKRQYENVLRLADKVSCTQHECAPACCQKCSEYLVDNADFLIAVWDGTRSGTDDAMNYPKDNAIVIIRIDPRDLSCGRCVCKVCVMFTLSMRITTSQ